MIPVIKKILFTTDLSENSRHAFTYAAALSTLHGARIIMLHVMEESTSSVNKHIANLFGEEKWQEMQEEHKLSARGLPMMSSERHWPAFLFSRTTRMPKSPSKNMTSW